MPLVRRTVSSALAVSLALPSVALASPGDEVFAGLLRPSYSIGGPGCQPVSVPVVGSFDRMSGHYSATLAASDPGATAERLTLNASSPVEGPITCTWQRSSGEPPNDGWRAVGALALPGQPPPGDDAIRCAVTDTFASDTRVVSRAMIAAYVADPSRFNRCEPEVPPADDDQNGNGVNDDWERQQEEGGGGEGGGGGRGPGGGDGPLALPPQVPRWAMKELTTLVAGQLQLSETEARRLLIEAYVRSQSSGQPWSKEFEKAAGERLANPVTVLACIACAGAAIATIGFAVNTLIEIENVRRAAAANRPAGWAAVLTSFKITVCSGLVSLATCLICPYAAHVEVRLATAIFQLTGLALATVVGVAVALVAACVGL
jgi:hypothetical protein